jgi:hypothetical protein
VQAINTPVNNATAPTASADAKQHCNLALPATLKRPTVHFDAATEWRMVALLRPDSFVKVSSMFSIPALSGSG